MLRAIPFLMFDGRCAEAMTFYQACLGGDLQLMPLGDTPMKQQFPPEKHGRIINARLKTGNLELSATDWMSDDVMPRPGNMMSVYLTGGEDELRIAFDALADGTARDATFQDLHELPFGIYGQLTDRYDVPWIFVSES